MNCPDGFVEHTNGQASRYNTNKSPYFRPQLLLLLLLDVFFFLFLAAVVVVVVGPFVESFVSFSLSPLAIVGFWNRAV